MNCWELQKATTQSLFLLTEQVLKGESKTEDVTCILCKKKSLEFVGSIVCSFCLETYQNMPAQISEKALNGTLVCETLNSTSSTKKKRNRRTPLHHFKAFDYSSLSAEEIYFQSKSLFTTLADKQRTITSALVYPKASYPEIHYEEGKSDFQELEDEYLKEYKKAIEMSHKGVYPPIEIVFREKYGYCARALKELPAHTFICEYTGDVRTVAETAYQHDNDSLFSLGTNKLVIDPYYRANLGRYLCGINSEIPEKIKENVKSFTALIEGKAHVLLITKKKIPKGTFLYYNYNDGKDITYVTKHFEPIE